MAAELTDLRLMFGKSLVAARDLAAGHTLVRRRRGLEETGDRNSRRATAGGARPAFETSHYSQHVFGGDES